MSCVLRSMCLGQGLESLWRFWARGVCLGMDACEGKFSVCVNVQNCGMHTDKYIPVVKGDIHSIYAVREHVPFDGLSQTEQALGSVQI